MNTTITPIIIEIGKINYQDVNDYNDECPICLEDLDNDNVVKLSCGHLLHCDCVRELFEKQLDEYIDLSCPICRNILMNTDHYTYQSVRDNIWDMDRLPQSNHQDNNDRNYCYNIAHICHTLITILFIITCIIFAILYFAYLI